jgi:hypothetical protein
MVRGLYMQDCWSRVERSWDEYLDVGGAVRLEV